jgi:RNA polymerase sigma-70 factor (ECF subfamily)
MMNKDDRELLEKFRNMDTRSYAFNLIMRKYQQKIYGHVRRLVIYHEDADDVVQNTFVKAWRFLEKFNEESELYTWLYRISTNESITFLKQKRRKFFLPLKNIEKDFEYHIQTEKPLDGDEIMRKLQKAILRLPEKQRIVFNLKYYDELSYEEMSQVLHTSVGALKASYHHAVKKIEDFLKAG